MAIHKKGQAHWEGDLKRGKGTVSTESGALKQLPYGFNTRFEGVQGTNPEELIGAAHAACFSMALSMILGEVGYTADSIDTTATVTLDQVDGGFAITKIALKSAVKVPGACPGAAPDAHVGPVGLEGQLQAEQRRQQDDVHRVQRLEHRGRNLPAEDVAINRTVGEQVQRSACLLEQRPEQHRANNQIKRGNYAIS